jgi:hypothetical protein
MYHVIDTIFVNHQLSERYPDGLPEGLWVILDPGQTVSVVPPQPGRMAIITRPDGSGIHVQIRAAEVHHGVLALQFEDLIRHDVPRLSVVEWP